MCQQWDAVQEFCASWEQSAGTRFRECCHDYQDLEEFESLLREHFRQFLAHRLDQGVGLNKASRKVGFLESNPFRGLNSFEFKHGAFYHGRTKAVGELLDILKDLATAKKSFLLVTGPSGSGKSSLVQAGVLPILTRGGTPVGNGPWRYGLTRPGAGDPFVALAVALLAKNALPELQNAASPAPDQWRNLASQLRKDPKEAAARVTEVLDQLSRRELEHLLNQRKIEGVPTRRGEGPEVISPNSRGLVKLKMRLALVVDQLEELFTGGSAAVQQKYIAALCALANCEGMFIIATLRSDFYPRYQRLPEVDKLTALGGRYELQPPTLRGIGDMIRLPADAAGLRFERDPETGRSLDQTLLRSAINSPAPLPLLEYVLSRLYQSQLARKDGLLSWSDYRRLGGFKDALAKHAEFVFLTLKRDEQQALKSVIRHLVALETGEEGLLNRRTVPYRDLVSSAKLNERQRTGAKGLVDRLVEEGLLRADIDSKQELLISVPQEALLRSWPRLWESLSEDRLFFRLRDRLDASLKPWLLRGRQSDDLLGPGIARTEAETLLRDFGSLLSGIQVDYIQKSLAKQKWRRLAWKITGLAAIVGLAVLAAFAGVEQFDTQNRRSNSERGVQPTKQNTDSSTNQRSALEVQRNELETKLKQAEERLQQAQQNA
ncbi:MAG: AAA family ATPase, partial [Verrucomicrobia bacterium]|nr:AAA family ATPase [Verrucomicrobiota bacterium]